MNQGIKKMRGNPYPMGVSCLEDGRVNFAVPFYGKEESGIILYPRTGGKEIRIPFEESERAGNIECIQLELEPDAYDYNFYLGNDVHTDAYARIIYGNEKWGYDNKKELRAGIRKEEFDWEGDKPLMIPGNKSILYLLHVRGFTRHISSNVTGKGCFQGIVEKIPYLKELGITAIEVMPAYEFEELELPEKKQQPMEYAMQHYMDKPEDDNPRINYWGFKQAYYFAPKSSYSCTEDPVREFKQMVKSLHQAGIEIIMQFYFPQTIKQGYMLEVIRSWVYSYHIDGVHLLGEHIPVELLATDPMLGNTKLFYYDFPCKAIYDSELAPEYKNLFLYRDDFMYDMRKFLKSDEGMVETALAHIRRNPAQLGVVKYITNYNGFTLADLVSYDSKHNEANGEENRDGASGNVSWNCGQEGKTRRKSVLELRNRQIRNALLFVLLSQGTPLLVSGDEFGNSQDGNNNPWCQDSKLTWLDWGGLKKQEQLFLYVKKLIRIRSEHPVFRQEKELTMMDTISCGYPDLSYHTDEAWRLKSEITRRHAGLMYCGRYAKTDWEKDDNFFYLAYNMHWEIHSFALPRLPKGMEWYLLADTGNDGEERPLADQKTLTVPGRTVQVLIERQAAIPAEAVNEAGEIGNEGLETF